jgi:hypothetical protein
MSVTALQASRLSSRCNRTSSLSSPGPRAEELHLALAMRRCGSVRMLHADVLMRVLQSHLHDAAQSFVRLHVLAGAAAAVSARHHAARDFGCCVAAPHSVRLEMEIAKT